MRIRFILASFLLSTAVVSACGSSAPKTPAPTGGASAKADPMCPAEVAGTSVSAEDTDTGGALVFVTTGDAAEVRKRVAAMATMHNDHHGAMGALPTGKEEPGAGHDHSKMGAGEMEGMDHSKMGAGEKKGAGDMAGMDHSKMGAGDKKGGGEMAGMDHSKMGAGEKKGGEMAGMDHSKMGDMAEMMISVHTKAVAQDVDGGARLMFVAFPGDVAKLQGELRQHAQHMAAGSCAMAPQ